LRWLGVGRVQRRRRQKRAWFAPLIAQGVPSAQACRTVGVNPRTLKRWRHGRTITGFVADRLDKRWSHAPRREFPDDPSAGGARKSIYQAIYRPQLRGLRRVRGPGDVAASHTAAQTTAVTVPW
jgi:hypothetical protein